MLQNDHWRDWYDDDVAQDLLCNLNGAQMSTRLDAKHMGWAYWICSSLYFKWDKYEGGKLDVSAVETIDQYTDPYTGEVRNPEPGDCMLLCQDAPFCVAFNYESSNPDLPTCD